MDGISCCKDCKNPMRKAVSGPPESQVKKSKVRHGSVRASYEHYLSSNAMHAVLIATTFRSNRALTDTSLAPRIAGEARDRATPTTPSPSYPMPRD